MKLTCQKYKALLGLTLIEVLVLIAITVILIGYSFHNHRPAKFRAYRIQCNNNLRSLGVAVRLYAKDDNSYPQFNPNYQAWQYFQILGREIGSPKVLLCPADESRMEQKTRSQSFDESSNGFSGPPFQNKALSYFYGTDANETNANTLLMGDRNISTNESILTGTLTLRTNILAKWTKDLHIEAGNVSLSDGSVQQLSSLRLQQQLAAVTNETQTLVLP